MTTVFFYVENRAKQRFTGLKEYAELPTDGVAFADLHDYARSVGQDPKNCPECYWSTHSPDSDWRNGL